MIRVKEVFPTLQGEGSLTGSPAVFVRLSGCNLWSGIEADRDKGRGDCAGWCDTDFAGGESYSPARLVEMVREYSDAWVDPLVVVTGGEPMLQLRKPAGQEFAELMSRYARIAIETNGTIAVPSEVAVRLSHITVSPKPLRGRSGSTEHIKQRSGQDLKVVIPTPFDLKELDSWAFKHRFVQPCDIGDNGKSNLGEVIHFARALGWRVSLQTHKLAGLP
mgnify:CR=1 FL=1